MPLTRSPLAGGAFWGKVIYVDTGPTVRADSRARGAPLVTPIRSGPWSGSQLPHSHSPKAHRVIAWLMSDSSHLSGGGKRPATVIIPSCLELSAVEAHARLSHG